jgi:uncharacterized membrane protein
MTLTVTLYSRQDCRLCDVAEEDLLALRKDYPHELLLLDVDQDESLQAAYGEKVPVIEVGPYRLSAPFTRQELQVTLGAARDRANQLESLDDPRYAQKKARGATISRADRFTNWFAIHYLLVFNSLVLLYVGLPFLAPVLMDAGARQPATMIYRAYGAVCHQLSFRSWFLFGEQSAYPRAAAGVEGQRTFGAATGINEEDLLAARAFTGNEELGYKVAFCERDVAIYGGILLFGLLYALTARRIPALPWYLWLLIGLVPIAADGVSQLISQPPFGLLSYRESTPLLRTLTGGLFGFTTAWFGFPQVELTMLDTRRILAHKFARAAATESTPARQA